MMPGLPRITLDQESFKALASDVRVEILKRLDARRETVTDLSNLMTLSKPTLLEHLEKLQKAGLVKRIDEGRKWIYYELSQKGRRILHPERVAITLALASAIALVAIGIVSLLVSSAGLLSAPRFDSAAPAQTAPADSLSLVWFALAGVLALVAGILHTVGGRRRARFFETLAVE